MVDVAHRIAWRCGSGRRCRSRSSPTRRTRTRASRCTPSTETLPGIEVCRGRGDTSSRALLPEHGTAPTARHALLRQPVQLDDPRRGGVPVAGLLDFLARAPTSTSDAGRKPRTPRSRMETALDDLDHEALDRPRRSPGLLDSLARRPPPARALLGRGRHARRRPPLDDEAHDRADPRRDLPRVHVPADRQLEHRHMHAFVPENLCRRGSHLARSGDDCAREDIPGTSPL